MRRPRLSALVDEALVRIGQRNQHAPETAEAINILSGFGQVCSLHETETFWQAGEPATHFLILLNGFVELIAPGKGRQRNVLGILGPGDIVGLPAVLSGTSYPATAAALSFRVDALSVPMAVARQREAKVVRAVLQAMVLHERVLRAKLAILAAGTVERRLALQLQQLDGKFGEGTHDRRAINVHLSRAHIAALVDARVETVIRVLAKWRKAGWFADIPTGFVIDQRRISRFLLRT